MKQHDNPSDKLNCTCSFSDNKHVIYQDIQAFRMYQTVFILRFKRRAYNYNNYIIYQF
jgi:hypothetical protein